MSKDAAIRLKSEVRTIDTESRTALFVISDETKDRHGTIIKMSGWDLENYKRNPIVGYQHEVHGSWAGGTNPDYIIGKSEVYEDNGQLLALVHFEGAESTGNELAESIFKKVQFGTLNATSVGFDPKEGRWGDSERGEDPDTFYYTRQDLLEFSIVNIPSNPSAVKKNAQAEQEFLKAHPKPSGDKQEFTPPTLEEIKYKQIKIKVR